MSVTLFADSCEANVTRVSTIRAIHFTATLKHNRQANPKKAHHYFNSSKNLRDVVIKTQERLCWRRRLESRTAQSLVNIHSCPKALDVLAARNGNSIIKIQHFVVGVNPVASTVLWLKRISRLYHWFATKGPKEMFKSHCYFDSAIKKKINNHFGLCSKRILLGERSKTQTGKKGTAFLIPRYFKIAMIQAITSLLAKRKKQSLVST